MTPVKQVSFITDAINFSKSFGKKSLTNYFLSADKTAALIEEAKVYSVNTEETIFLFKKNGDFYNLYFFASCLESFEQGLAEIKRTYGTQEFVVDVVLTQLTTPVVDVFTESGFVTYTSLVRMSRTDAIAINEEALADANQTVASASDAEQVFNLLNQYFDPRAEQLPDLAEVKAWINHGRVLVYKVNKELAGFIIFELNGLTLYLRYWFVSPNHRDKKIGSKLFNFFLDKGKASKRQLFWVIQTNENAIVRYRHYGFKEEKMYNFVLNNKNKKYEG
jgi:GNAT superfamily N-acetyltransferase